MPFYRVYMPRGRDDKAMEKSLREINAATADILENTLPTMVHVGVYESDPEARRGNSAHRCFQLRPRAQPGGQDCADG